jgi:hypothetical protein
MLRAGQLLPPKGLSTLGFDAGRFPPTPPACYRAAWPLPGPVSHRLASTSLRMGHLKATTSFLSSAPMLLGTTNTGQENETTVMQSGPCSRETRSDSHGTARVRHHECCAR